MHSKRDSRKTTGLSISYNHGLTNTEIETAIIVVQDRLVKLVLLLLMDSDDDDGVDDEDDQLCYP